MAASFLSSPAGSPLPEEVIDLIAHHLADLGSSRTTVSAMTASRAFHAVFSRRLRCAKLTLYETNCHSRLKGLEKAPRLRLATNHACSLPGSLKYKTRSTNFGFRYRPHHAWRLSPRKDRKRQSPPSKAVQRHAQVLSHCTHLTIHDLEAAQAVSQACETAKALDQEGLWIDVETLCLGPALMDRLGQLDVVALDTIDRLSETIWPQHLCMTLRTPDCFGSYGAIYTSSQLIEMLVGLWAPTRVSIHNVSTQRLPYIGAASIRVFWAAAHTPVDNDDIDRSFWNWQTLHDERANDIARMISCLSDDEERVEFCGLACLECVENKRENCTRDLEKAVLGFVEPPQFRSKVKEFVRYTTNPSPCEACGGC